MELEAHLDSFGIRHFEDASYRKWRRDVLGEARAAKLDELRRPMQEGRATPLELARYWDFVALPEVAGAVFSGRADAIRAAGKFVVAQLPSFGSILDIGCSMGHLATHYALVSPRAEVTGCDLSLESVRRAAAEAARRGLSNVRFLHGDWVTALPGASFDCVVATQALARTWNDERALAQVAALLPERGRFICVESLDREQAEAFVAGCAAHGLALRSFEMLHSRDAGVDDACPGFVFEKGGPPMPVELAAGYASIRAALKASQTPDT